MQPASSGSGCLKVGLILLGVLVVFGVLAVGCLAFVGNEVVNEIDRAIGEADPGDYDLSEGDCIVDPVLGAQATGTIKNTSDKAQGFQIEVRFETSDGDLVSEDSTFTDTIAVDQSQSWEVTSLDEIPDDVTLVCKVGEVSYSIFDNEGGN